MYDRTFPHVDEDCLHSYAKEALGIRLGEIERNVGGPLDFRAIDTEIAKWATELWHEILFCGQWEDVEE
jgi:hypothetical protein